MHGYKLGLVLLFVTLAFAANNFKKIMVEDAEALCLDGTLGAYYAHEGYFPNKIIISFEGGGWCGSSAGLNETLEDCLGRSKMWLGSSSSYEETWSQSEGILSDSYQNQYREWTIFHLKYCTGTGHQGYRKSSVYYKNTNLYFRGHKVAIAQLNSIDKYYGIFSKATDIIVTGQSAGGLATYLWTNYIAERAPKTAKVLSLPDSGIFLDSTNFVTGKNDYKQIFLNFMKLSNDEIDPPVKECVAAYPQEKYKCMFAQYIHPFINVPQFAIQSPYDSWSLPNILGIACENGGSLSGCGEGQLRYIEDYHANTSAVLKAIGTKKTNGYWAPSCSNHVYSTWNGLYDSAYRVPMNTQYSLMYCIVQWASNLPGSYEHMDSGNWPINKPCSGVKSIMQE